MEKPIPARKQNRLPEYDYSQNGAYFITVCTKNRAEILWEKDQPPYTDVGACIARPCLFTLSQTGKIVEQSIRQIEEHYPAVKVEKYVVMPNHLHLLLMIDNDQGGRAMHAPTISKVVEQMKGWVTKQLGHAIWQKSFHDHVIRTAAGGEQIWQYIDTNPQNWQKDCFYTHPTERKDPA